MKLTPEEVTSICNAAEKAWEAASPKAKHVNFDWNGSEYRSELTTFRMLVQTIDGTPIAERFH